MQLHFATFVILHFGRFQQFSDIILDQQGTPQYTHDLNNRPVRLEIVFDDTNDAVGDNRNVYLDTDSILRFSPKGFDSEVLFNPLEKQLNLPSVLVQKCNILGCEVEIVCVIGEGSLELRRIINDSPDRNRIIPFVPFSCKSNCLISENVVLSVKNIFPVFDFIVGIELLAYDEECSVLLNDEEPCKVKVTSVKHIARKRFVYKPIHGVDIMDFCSGDSVEYRYFRNDINLRVYPDSRLRASELCPLEYRHAKVNCSGVHSIESAMKFKISCDAPTLCLSNHMKGKLFKDSVISDGVSFGQRLSVNGYVAETQEKRFLTMSDSYICKFSEASATQQLSEHQYQHVTPMRERPAFGLVVVLGNYTPELSLRKELRDLSENILPDMHGNTDFDSAAKVAISKVGHAVEKIRCCA